MIRPEYIGQNLRVSNFVRQSLTGHKVINPPPCVAIAGMESIAPPGVNIGLIRIKVPESVHESCL